MTQVNVSVQDITDWYENEIQQLRQRVRGAEVSLTVVVRERDTAFAEVERLKAKAAAVQDARTEAASAEGTDG